MHVVGEIKSIQRSLDGELSVEFYIDEDNATLEELTKLKDTRLTIDVKKYRQKRSLNANAYFWKLCDEIAKALGSDKDTIYLKELKDHGVYIWIEVIEQAVTYIEPLYRLIEIDHYYSKPMVDEAGSEYTAKMSAVKCYIGSSQYDTKQMSDLIEGTVNEAHDLGISTWTQEEIDNLISRWEPQYED